ncbi:MAG: rhodanese-like domain-containing protein [Planctomycetota bacterium]
MTTPATTTPPPMDLSPAELKAELKQGGAVLIDLREAFEHQAEQIEGAVHMPLGTLDPDTIRQHYQDKKIIFHCAGGKRSAKACRQFDPRGPTHHLAGGIEAWKQAGLPTRKPTAQGTIPVMRQVQITAGLLVLIGLTLGHFVAMPFYLLSVLIGCGLAFAGVSGWCGMAKLLARMPWNKAM